MHPSKQTFWIERVGPNEVYIWYKGERFVWEGDYDDPRYITWDDWHSTVGGEPDEQRFALYIKRKMMRRMLGGDDV